MRARHLVGVITSEPWKAGATQRPPGGAGYQHVEPAPAAPWPGEDGEEAPPLPADDEEDEAPPLPDEPPPLPMEPPPDGLTGTMDGDMPPLPPE